MVMKYLQRLGKSLMLPVAVLPIAALMLGIGYAIDPNGWGGGNVVAMFLCKAGGAILDNLAVLFAVGVAVGMSDDQHGASALAGLVSWFIVVTVLSSGGLPTHVFKEGSTQLASFGKIQNVFVGILTGLIGGHCYNFFKNTKLPAFLSFFSGRRAVAIVAGGVSLLLSLVLLFVWPYVYLGLVNMGKGMISLGPVGAGLYGFLNRLLIPTGLHHALNNVFWFDLAGINDINTFLGGKWDATAGVYVNGAGEAMSSLKQGQAGMYQAGFFPIMMFGLPGAALAMYLLAKPEKKKVTLGLLSAGALASFATGVTEPLEFAFMFLAPVLYGVHALLTGISCAIVAALPVRAGFAFSAGLIDYLLSIRNANAQNLWAILLIGLGFFAVYFGVFFVLIKAMNIKTPGREDDEENDLKVELSNSDYAAVAALIIEGLGGKENIKTLDNCVTRLRLEIRDYTQVNEKKIKSAGVSGVLRPSKDTVQVIVGTKVQFVADEMKRQM